jgi:hypothetical protein
MPVTDKDVADPFESTCVPLDRDIMTLLRYYAEINHPSVWKTEHCLRPYSKDYFYQFTSHSIISDCLQHAASLFALIASMASQSLLLHNIKTARTTSYYLGKALPAARQSVAQATCFSDRLILNIFHLACAEFWREQREQASIHLHWQTLCSAVVSRGGLTKLDATLREAIILGDGYAAADAERPPSLDTSGVEQIHILPVQLRRQYTICKERNMDGLDRTSSAFLSRPVSEIIPSDLRQQIQSLAVSIELLKQFSGARPHQVGHDSALHWVHVETLLVRHRLLSMQHDDWRVDAIRLGLIAWTMLVLSNGGRIVIVKAMARKSQARLSLMDDSKWIGLEQLHCWILLLWAQCSEQGSATRRWFVSELRRCQGLLAGSQPVGIWTAEDMLDFSQDFFVLEQVERSTLVQIADLLKRC